ncbi:MAG: HD domain-containing protein [Candidatus Omnitrophota bacterium]|jgi:exopolyphosphatase/guanosine-5'-triphosphate,3'-diphosphate pyrophosphatase|nr:MAG: HD domain-containing protein [Candidatus Omnitrophota bacterium]
MNYELTSVVKETTDANEAIDSIREFTMQNDLHPQHAFHVSYLSLRLFDQLVEIHACGSEERKLLECAACLHDIGWTVSRQKHHKHSMHIILNTDFPELTQREKEIVANIARYHRKAVPLQKHREYAFLVAEDRQIVKKMSALLRIAEGLDWTRNASIRDVICYLIGNECVATLVTDGDSSEERAMAQKKKKLFRDVYGVDFRLIYSDEINGDLPDGDSCQSLFSEKAFISLK